MRQYMITVFIIVITAIGGFMLPSKFLQWQDQLRLESAGAQETEEVILAARTDMTLIEKMQLIQKSSATAVSMEQGKNYTRDSIIDKAESELQKLIELEILNLDSVGDMYSIDNIWFLVDTEDGTKSMILWIVSVYTGEYSIGFSMDDETGKILSISQVLSQVDTSSQALTQDGISNWAYDSEISIENTGSYSELKEIAEKWGEYLGLSLAEVYDTPNPTADIYKVREREIEVLVKKGIDKEEATQRVYEAWGIEAEESVCWLYGVYEDENGIAAYLFQKNMGQIVFSAQSFI